jgi:mitochondrial import receptor subunit TOM70
MEAAQAFTDALDILEQHMNDKVDETSTKSLLRQIVTLMNNRSAMYEKANHYELSLEDCNSILTIHDIHHNKARMRKLRILEELKRYREALIEVCAIQLLFMQTNRTNLRLGLPVPSPPVSQSKMEDLVAHVLPLEMESYIVKLEEQQQQKSGGTSTTSTLSRPLPSPYTILQLLRSYTGYNGWMAQAAKDGSIDKLTQDVTSLGSNSETSSSSSVETIVQHATLLLKRGRRYVYERNYDKAGNDFEEAYKLVEGNKEVQDAMINTQTNENYFARLLEWLGMNRHWHYELDSAYQLYQMCADLEPTNALILVKQAGVQLDANKHEEALQLFDTALGIDPDLVDALLHRSNLFMLQGKTSEAKNDLELCVKKRPNYVMARLRLAAIFATTDANLAKQQLDYAEQYEPNSSEIQSYRGEVYFTQGEMDLAYQHFIKAMDLEKSNPTPYVNAAMALLNTPMTAPGQVPNTTEVIRLLEKAIEIDNQFTAAYIHLGQLKLGTSMSLNDAKDVIQLYDQGLQNCRSPEEIKELCGMRLLAMSQIEAATQLKMETFAAA